MNAQNRSLLKVHAAGVACCAAMAAGAYLVGVRPAVLMRREHAELAAALERRRGETAAIESEAVAAQRRLEEIRLRLESQTVTLEPPSRLNERLATISGLLESGGMRIERVEPGTPTPTDRYTAVPIDLRGEATYPQILEFLSGLRAVYPDVAVRGLKLNSPSLVEAAAGAGGSGPGTYELGLVWFAAAGPEAGAGDPARATATAATP